MDSPEPPRFILFLPPVLPGSSPKAIKEAFGDTISQVLKEVASHSSESRHAAVLEIALAIPSLVGKQHVPRSTLYDDVQASVAAVYKLVCVIAAEDGVNVEDHDGIDVRVLLIAWSPDRSGGQSTSTGPVVDLGTLARSGRQWQFAFGVESDAGEAMVKAFVAAKGSGSTTQSGGASEDPKQRPSATSEAKQRQRNAHVAVGGTFDHIHIGHKLLLTMTLFAVDEAVDSHPDCSATIGITGDQLLVNKKHAEVLESWSDRQQAVRTFLDSVLNFSSTPPSVTTRDDPGLNGKSVDVHYGHLVVKCTEIQDPFGPTITDEQISALIISGETRSGGKAVNDKRTEKGWRELEVFEVDVLDAEGEDESSDVKEGFGSKLSSTAIREKLAKKTAVPGSRIHAQVPELIDREARTNATHHQDRTEHSDSNSMALRNLIQAKVTGSNAINELDTIDCFTDEWDTDARSKLTDPALEIHLSCMEAASELKAIVDILDAFLGNPALGGQMGIFMEIAVRRENAASEIVAILKVVEGLAEMETVPESLSEIRVRTQRLSRKLDGLKTQIDQLENIVVQLAPEQQQLGHLQGAAR
ncbi:hypothetical protein LTR15_009916 [Elasticomyces elasticus]|nr:hypothetical protein LTR15_009916 [Elasticomyces elasticus]